MLGANLPKMVYRISLFEKLALERTTMSKEVIEALKAQIKSTSDPSESRDAISLLEIYGYKAVPALRDIMQDCSSEEMKEYCREALKKLGWLPQE